MLTFKEAKAQVLEYIKRNPNDSDFETRAGFAINQAIVKAQQLIEFHYLEDYLNATYPANTFSISVTDQNGENVNKFKAVDQVSSPGEMFGKPLEVRLPSELHAMRNNYFANFSRDRRYSEYYHHDTGEGFSYFVKNTYNYVAVPHSGGLGLFPVPESSVELSLLVVRWMPRLVDDGDSNFFLDQGWNFVFYEAISRLNLFLTEMQRVEIAQSLLTNALNELEMWNSSLKHSDPVDMH